MHKKSQGIGKQDDFPQFQQVQRFLELENYVYMLSKSKVRISFNCKEEYQKCFELLSQTFLINFVPFEDKNTKIESQNPLEMSDPLLQDESLQSILRHCEKGKLIKSYGGFTRRTNQVVFVLVLRNKDRQNSVNSESRFLFLNEEGRVIHIVSNLIEANIEDLSKFVAKHFRKLENMFVLDRTCNFQEASNITKQLYKSKITKVLVYVSPFGQKLEENLKEIVLDRQSEIFSSKIAARVNNDLNLVSLILRDNGQQVREPSWNIERSLRFQQIHDFIIKKSFQPQLAEKNIKQILFSNLWLNNVFTWYFNVILSLGDQLPLEKNPIAAIKQINNKIATYFASKLQSKKQSNQDYNKLPGKCFPDLLQTTKHCLVCKKRKTKFGCLKCSQKYKLIIHLCVENCFKDFHKNSIRYLKQKFLPKNEEAKNPELKQTSNTKKSLFEDHKMIKKQKNKEHTSHSRVENKCKCQDPIWRPRLIKGKLKRILRESESEPAFMTFRGVKLLDFQKMEDIEINSCKAPENINEEQSKQIYESEKESGMDEEISSFTDSLLL